MALSIIVPVYNEEKALSQTIASLEEFYAQFPGLEIIFVDDGSVDDSAKILEAHVRPQTKVIRHASNRGYGAALKSGIKKAQGDLIAITDADASYPHEKIGELVDHLQQEEADMAVGARAGEIVESGFFRRWPKFFLRKLAEYLSNEKIPDFNSGLRVIRKAAVLKALRYLPDGFSFTTTITLYLIANGGKVIYLPINYYRRQGKSKIRPIRDTLNFLQLIVRTIMFFNPLRVFLPLSIFFMLLSMVVLVVSTLLGKVMDITTVLLFVTGLNLLAIGLLADMIDKRTNK